MYLLCSWLLNSCLPVLVSCLFQMPHDYHIKNEIFPCTEGLSKLLETIFKYHFYTKSSCHHFQQHQQNENCCLQIKKRKKIKKLLKHASTEYLHTSPVNLWQKVDGQRILIPLYPFYAISPCRTFFSEVLSALGNTPNGIKGLKTTYNLDFPEKVSSPKISIA